MKNIIKTLYMKYLKKKDPVLFYRKIGVQIGEGTRLYNVNIDYGHAFLLSIGKDCILTNCTILTHDGSTKMLLGKSKVGKVIIGDNVFIGFQSLILSGVRVGNNVIIGAGSIVTKDVPENCIVSGNPAKVISTKDEFNIKHLEAYKNHPVWNTYWVNKTDEEKADMLIKLEDTYGYDV